MIKAIALDDEPIALEIIQKLAAKISFLELQESFTDPFRAIDHLQKRAVDLIFLDINMPDISGIDFLKSIQKPPMVIFTTAYSEHAVQSFEMDAVDYLLKPFSLARFLKACTKAQEQHEFRKNGTGVQHSAATLFIKSGYEQIRVETNEILYVESSGNYVQFVLANRKIWSRLTMQEAEELLPAHLFIRIHRSFIAAKSKVTRIERNNIWIDQFSLPVGAAYSREIEKIYRKP